MEDTKEEWTSLNRHSTNLPLVKVRSRLLSRLTLNDLEFDSLCPIPLSITHPAHELPPTALSICIRYASCVIGCRVCGHVSVCRQSETNDPGQETIKGKRCGVLDFSIACVGEKGERRSTQNKFGKEKETKVQLSFDLLSTFCSFHCTDCVVHT